MKPQKDKIRRKNESPPNLGKQASPASEAIDQKAFRNLSENIGSEK